MATEQEVERFTEFARQQLRNGGADLSLHELLEMWLAERPTSEELAESVAAVKGALADMEAGDTGIPMDEHLSNLRRKYDLTAEG